MKQKFLTIVVIMILLIVGASVTSNAKLIEKKNNNSKILNQEVFLGYANIYGDGVQGNTVIEVEAENDLVVKIQTSPTNLDFYIEYDIDTNNGLNDNGAVSFLLQIDGAQVGHNETLTFDDVQGRLYIDEVEVEKGDVFSFEVGALYTNILPPFTVPGTAFGGGWIPKARVNIIVEHESISWLKDLIISRFLLLGRLIT
jgi:hypothetical protein